MSAFWEAVHSDKWLLGFLFMLVLGVWAWTRVDKVLELGTYIIVALVTLMRGDKQSAQGSQ